MARLAETGRACWALSSGRQDDAPRMRAGLPGERGATKLLFGVESMDAERVVGRYDAPHEAELAAAYLRSHGIGARVEDNLLAGMNPLWGLALGGIRLFVSEETAEQAHRLLADLDQRSSVSADAENERVDVTTGEENELARAYLLYESGPGEDRASGEGDERARRVLAAGLVGSFLLPGVLNAIALGWALTLSAGELSRRGRRHRRLAIGINLGIIIALLLVVLVGPWLRIEPADRENQRSNQGRRLGSF